MSVNTSFHFIYIECFIMYHHLTMHHQKKDKGRWRKVWASLRHLITLFS